MIRKQYTTGQASLKKFLAEHQDFVQVMIEGVAQEGLERDMEERLPAGRATPRHGTD